MPDGTKKRIRRRIIIVKIVKKPKEDEKSPIEEEPVEYEEVEIDEANPDDEKFDPEVIITLSQFIALLSLTVSHILFYGRVNCYLHSMNMVQNDRETHLILGRIGSYLFIYLTQPGMGSC